MILKVRLSFFEWLHVIMALCKVNTAGRVDDVTVSL